MALRQNGFITKIPPSQKKKKTKTKKTKTKKKQQKTTIKNKNITGP
jgi:hypothetical protein